MKIIVRGRDEKEYPCQVLEQSIACGKCGVGRVIALLKYSCKRCGSLVVGVNELRIRGPVEFKNSKPHTARTVL